MATEHGSIGRMEAQMKTKNRMDVMSSRTQSPKQNIVCSNHRKYATKLRVLLMDIKNHKEDFINTNKEDRNSEYNAFTMCHSKNTLGTVRIFW